ncbi:hypothetical protein IFM89_034814 [Coptis chinensis]|uniref:Pentatricopeptide repeat-containing protein n=1 Tax=Coptis chinensis TaxID=261450 RepID=A0A835H8W0_9MAGN|nr:hypothetical protein IFM89_034814 [Coptis chinensis]
MMIIWWVFLLMHRKKNEFEEARRLMEDFWSLRKFPLGHMYGIWIRDLVQAGKLDGAMDFWQSKKLMERFVVECVIEMGWTWKEVTEENVKVFDKVSQRGISDVVSWNSIVGVFVRSGEVGRALNMFGGMNSRGVGLRADVASLVNILPACASVGALMQGCCGGLVQVCVVYAGGVKCGGVVKSAQSGGVKCGVVCWVAAATVASGVGGGGCCC